MAKDIFNAKGWAADTVIFDELGWRGVVASPALRYQGIAMRYPFT